MYPTMAMIDIELATLVSMESTLPYVICTIFNTENLSEIIAMQLTPIEAMEIGTWFIQAGESALDESLTVVSLRSNKISEETILSVLLEKRKTRLMIERNKE